MELENNNRRKAKDENSHIGGNHVTFNGRTSGWRKLPKGKPKSIWSQMRMDGSDDTQTEAAEKQF